MALIPIIEACFPEIFFESFEIKHDVDLCSDIDYLGWIGKKAFGIQIKPITSKANFGNYSASERMKASFIGFSQKYGGSVFVIYSEKEKIQNIEVLKQIAVEIESLSK